MENYDAAVITVDDVVFSMRRRMNGYGYALAMAADNTGHIFISEFPERRKIRHRPRLGRKARWDFAFDGFSIYQKTGGLPDIVVFWLMIVKDRKAARKAGEVLTLIASDSDFEAVTKAASVALKGSAVGTLITEAVGPVLNLIGKHLKKVDDRLIDSIGGTVIVDSELRKAGEEEDTVKGTGFKADFEIALFDAQIDGDSVASMNSMNAQWSKEGSLIIVRPE